MLLLAVLVAPGCGRAPCGWTRGGGSEIERVHAGLFPLLGGAPAPLRRLLSRHLAPPDRTGGVLDLAEGVRVSLRRAATPQSGYGAKHVYARVW